MERHPWVLGAKLSIEGDGSRRFALLGLAQSLYVGALAGVANLNALLLCMPKNADDFHTRRCTGKVNAFQITFASFFPNERSQEIR
jgi:hypothetical protein